MSDEETLRDALRALREVLRVEPSPSLLRQMRASAAEARTGSAAVWPLATAAMLVLASAAALALFRSPRPKALEAVIAPASRSAPGGRSHGSARSRTFNAVVAVILRDGQTTQYVSATDPVSGESVRLDVAVSVIK